MHHGRILYQLRRAAFRRLLRTLRPSRSISFCASATALRLRSPLLRRLHNLSPPRPVAAAANHRNQPPHRSFSPAAPSHNSPFRNNRPSRNPSATAAQPPKSSGGGKALLIVGGIFLVLVLAAFGAVLYGVHWVKHKVSSITGGSFGSEVAQGNMCKLLSTARAATDDRRYRGAQRGNHGQRRSRLRLLHQSGGVR